MKRATVTLAIVMVTLFVGMSVAQDSKSDLAVSATGILSKSSSGNATLLDPTKSAGFLGSYRYSFTPHSAVELNYGYTRNSQLFTNSTTTSRVENNMHEWTAAYVYKFGSERLQPFVLAGTGALIFSPRNSAANQVAGASTQAKPVFLYGGGLDFKLMKNVALRGQYRGLVYGAPDFGLTTLTTSSKGHIAEPTLGIVFRF
jgi:outer membrane immunogenic protein